MTRSKKLNFRGALSEVFWNWQPQGMPHHQVYRSDKPDNPYISIDKLCFTPTEYSYKCELQELEPGVWEKLNKFFDCVMPMLEPMDKKTKTTTNEP